MLDSLISEKILTELSTGSKSSSALVEKISKSCGRSIQSVYAVLSKLQSQSIVLRHKKLLILNTVWIEQKISFFRNAQESYLDLKVTEHFSIGTLENGDKVSFQFKNPVLLDEMWGHLFILLLQKIPPAMPVMIYNPHAWFPVGRFESEKTIFQSLFDKGHKAYFSIAGKEVLDMDIAKKFIKPIGHGFSLGADLGLKKTQYLNIIGEYVIEVELDNTTTERIDDYFKKYKTLAEADKSELQAIVEERGRNKLTLIHSTKKAHKWRSRLAKDFMIAPESRRFV